MTAAVHKSLCLACLVLAAGALPSCSSASKEPRKEVTEEKSYTLNELYNLRPAPPKEPDPVMITKVKIFRLNTLQRLLPTADRAIRFEQERLLYGAITQRQRTERNGQYYTIMWRAKDRTQPMTVRFEYRQQNTGLKIHVKEEEVTPAAGTNTTRFQVISKEFHEAGAVMAWRVTLLRGKEELAHADSFLWK